jgi:alkylhydroperoxidase/carboxymuconolactone decarboxylase family protein YurZ
MSGDAPVLDTLSEMTEASVTHSSLPPRDFMLARLAALIAVDGPPISYLASAPAIEASGLTAEDIQGIMIAVAPVVGAPRVMSAGGTSCVPSASRSR